VILSYGRTAKGLAFQGGVRDAWEIMARDYPDRRRQQQPVYWLNRRVVDLPCVRVDSRERRTLSANGYLCHNKPRVPPDHANFL